MVERLPRPTPKLRTAALLAGALIALAAPASAGAVIFTVTTTADSGPGSLRNAIESANAATGPDDIDFGGAGEGTITPLSALPASTDELGIDGGLAVTLDGSSLAGAEAGLRIAANDNQIAGMIIQDFPGNGIEVQSPAVNAAIEGSVISSNGANGVVLAPGTTDAGLVGNMIGTDASGTTAQPNAQHGVVVSGSGHQIGGATAGAGNVISGNSEWGVDIAARAADPHRIRGNQIGTNAAGTAAVPNGSADPADGGGILLEAGATGTSVGGTLAGEGNLVSGNDGPGIRVAGTGSTVAGNMIGTEATGASAIANSDGVQVQGTPTGVVIGGSTAAANVISGNAGNGVAAQAGGVQVTANLIGTDAAGDGAIPNQAGVYVNADNVRVGGAGTGNVISGNTNYGVLVDQAGDSDGTVIEANRIGTNAAGAAAVANGVGIGALEAVNVGSGSAGAGNLISGNLGTGVRLENSDAGQASVVQGNVVGLDATGLAALGNGGEGIRVLAGAPATRTDATIGGSASGQRNVISGNGGSGVSTEALTSVEIAGNWIGLGTNGTSALGNGVDGVRMPAGAQGNLVGGATAAANVIAHQTGSGVVDVSATGGNEIAGNSIFANGVLPIDHLDNDLLDSNDALDAAPPQNSPAITSALTNGSRVTLIGNLASAASRSYLLRFYAAGGGTCGGDDMRTFLGSRTVQTNGSGIAGFNVTLDATLVSGRCVVATATSPEENTSELGTGAASADAGAVQVAPTSYAALEGDGQVSVTVERSGSTAAPVGFELTTASGTAQAGQDFTTTAGTMSIPAESASTTVDVPIADDDPSEPSESFTVGIDSPTGAVLGVADTATVTITDDAFEADTKVTFLGSKTLNASRSGTVKVRVANSNPFGVAGELEILDGSRRLASEPAAVGPDAEALIKPKLKASALGRLERQGSLRAQLSLAVADGDAHERTVTRNVKLVR